MKINKNIKIIGLVLVAIIIFATFVFYFFFKKNDQTLKSKNFNLSDSRVQVVKVEDELSSDKKEIKDTVKKDNDIFLKVQGKDYSTFLKEGDRVYDVMNRLKDNGLNFTGKNNPVLGFFVESINDKKQGDGKYWMYSVNGNEAQVGISSYVLKKGDIISWELK